MATTRRHLVPNSKGIQLIPVSDGIDCYATCQPHDYFRSLKVMVRIVKTTCQQWDDVRSPADGGGDDSADSRRWCDLFVILIE